MKWPRGGPQVGDGTEARGGSGRYFSSLLLSADTPRGSSSLPYIYLPGVGVFSLWPLLPVINRHPLLYCLPGRGRVAGPVGPLPSWACGKAGRGKGRREAGRQWTAASGPISEPTGFANDT